MKSNLKAIAIAAICLSVAAAHGAVAPPQYTLTALKPFDSQWNYGSDINQLGQVVGQALHSGGLYAYLQSNEVAFDIGNAFSSSPSTATAVNNLGQVVGEAETMSLRVTHAFLYGEAGMIDLNPTIAGATYSIANDINDSGDVTGGWRPTRSARQRGFLYDDGASIDIGTLGGPFALPFAINDARQIVGQSEKSNGRLAAFLYSGGVMSEVPTPGFSSIARDINDAGQIVGEYKLPAGDDSNAFVYSQGALTTIPSPLADKVASTAQSINEKGQVLGQLNDLQPFLYSNGTTYLIADLLDESALGWTFSSLGGINDKGWIVVNGNLEGGNLQTLLLTPVPESASVTMAITAMMLLVKVSRRCSGDLRPGRLLSVCFPLRSKCMQSRPPVP